MITQIIKYQKFEDNYRNCENTDIKRSMQGSSEKSKVEIYQSNTQSLITYSCSPATGSSNKVEFMFSLWHFF